MTDRVIKNYEPRKFKTVYVAQRKVKNEWVDATEHEGFMSLLSAQASAKDLAHRGCISRVVEREVELPAAASLDERDLAYIAPHVWPEYDR